MSCAAFFEPYLEWLNQPSSSVQNVVNFLLSSGRNEANQFVLYSAGAFTPQPIKANSGLLLASARVYFSDRQSDAGGQAQPFDVNQSEVEDIRIDPQGQTLQRLNHASGNIIGLYSTFQCNSNGLLVCTSEGTKEMLIVSFLKGTAPPPIL